MSADQHSKVNSVHITPVKISASPPPLRCPSDKSVTHRAFLFSLLSPRLSRVEMPLLGQDCLASLAAVEMLGATVHRADCVVEIAGFGIKNFGGTGSQGSPLLIDCQNSGTTIRLLCGLLAGQRGYFRLFGDESLSQRPMARVSQPLQQMGAAVFPRGEKKGVRSMVPTPPIDIEPSTSGLRPIRSELSVASAQVKSAVLLAGLWCEEGEVSVSEPSLSRDHTERMLRGMGIRVFSEILADGRARAAIKGARGRLLEPLHVLVGGDPSSAAFWACAAMMQGRRVAIQDMLLNPARIGFARVLERMGARVRLSRETETGGEDIGTAEFEAADLRATEVLASEIPSLIDEVPVLAVTALWAKGTTVFRRVQELRVKESDRLEAILAFVRSIGGNAWSEGDDLFVEGIEGPPPGPSSRQWLYSTLGDHRLAMTAVVTADALQKEIVLDDAECIKVSYPNFFEHRALLSG